MKQAFLMVILLLMTIINFAFTSKTVTGVVSDEKGNPLTGASVVVKGTSKRMTTGTDGSFSIEINDKRSILVISAIGFQVKEITVGKESKFIIHLQANTRQLNEVVTTGYGTRMKKDTVEFVASSRTVAGGSLTPGSQPNITNIGPLGGLAVTGTITGGTIAGTLSPGTLNSVTSLGNLSGLAVTGVDQKRFFGNGNVFGNNYNREGYDHITENGFIKVADEPLSTFSIDVDAASYSNIRRILKSGNMPPEGAVRIEEMINYFHYEYAQPTGKDPFAVHTEMAVCPWNKEHQLVLIGLQGKKINVADLPSSNLTFLIDVSGSMFMPDKLPLVKESLKLLVDQLRPNDKVAIVAYAGNAGLVLLSTGGDNKTAIKESIDRLEAGGSTAGGEGIQLAYKIARENFNKEGNNRVILCTDGDFNVGVSSDAALEAMIEQERKSGVYLTVLGFGTGNYQDAKMQKLADKGNGNHAYIDQLSEAKKVLINEFGGTLFTIAKDVKLQIEFNPEKIKGYRLIGYEKRILAKEDFNNDKKDAGELGSGHTVTALYELVPIDAEMPGQPGVDPLRYQPNNNVVKKEPVQFGDEVMNIKLRYKQPDSDISSLISHPVRSNTASIENATDNFRFATAVASFGMLLCDSPYKGSSSYGSAKMLAQNATGNDKEGYRKEFLELIDAAAVISDKKEMARKLGQE